MILAGDVGGTKTVLALFQEQPDGLRLIREATQPSRNFSSLEAVIGRFLEGGSEGKVTAACFGVAGALVGGRGTVTNLSWTLDEAALAESLGNARTTLLNDLEAAAWGVMKLPPDALAVLQPGTRRQASMALIAAGTGLGEALMIWD